MGSHGAVAVCCTIIGVVLFSAVPIAMICMGALYQDQCPMEPWIPTFMIVGGSLSLLSILLVLIMQAAKSLKKPLAIFCVKILIVIVGLFTIGWFIAGSVWVLNKWDEMKKTRGCYIGLYLFAFSLLITFWACGPCCFGGSAHKHQKNDM